MRYLAAWYRERPRVVEAVQLAGTGSVEDLATFLGARSWHARRPDVEFFGTLAGTLSVSWGDWVVRLRDADFEVVPAALFELLYEPCVP